MFKMQKIRTVQEVFNFNSFNYRCFLCLWRLHLWLFDFTMVQGLCAFSRKCNMSFVIFGLPRIMACGMIFSCHTEQQSQLKVNHMIMRANQDTLQCTVWLSEDIQFVRYMHSWFMVFWNYDRCIRMWPYLKAKSICISIYF